MLLKYIQSEMVLVLQHNFALRVRAWDWISVSDIPHVDVVDVIHHLCRPRIQTGPVLRSESGVPKAKHALSSVTDVWNIYCGTLCRQFLIAGRNFRGNLP